MEPLTLYVRLVTGQLRAQMQYKVSFLLALLGSFLVNLIEFGVAIAIFTRIPALVGWSLPEVALLYGLSGVSFAVAEVLASALDRFDVHIVQGTFDRVLVRPRGALFQVISEDFALRRFGRVGQGVLVLVLALQALTIAWDAQHVAVLALTLVSGVAIYFSIFVLGATFCFWTTQGKEATHVLTYGGDALAEYPLDIYHGVVRRFFTFVMPLAFVAYEPALYLLGREDPLGMPAYVPLLSPLAAALMGLLAYVCWQHGVRHYQSTGT
ncbi:MAG TPA: ABC-2 family transporter protein [Chloroflexota bacterium]|jgi:ABC-2 type transport system permease protein|nr:ABC-2 family transporter protein [Chloroflexota bacterium]